MPTHMEGGEHILWERELSCTCCVMLRNGCDASPLHNFGPDVIAAN